MKIEITGKKNMFIQISEQIVESFAFILKKNPTQLSCKFILPEELPSSQSMWSSSS